MFSGDLYDIATDTKQCKTNKNSIRVWASLNISHSFPCHINFQLVFFYLFQSSLCPIHFQLVLFLSFPFLSMSHSFSVGLFFTFPILFYVPFSFISRSFISMFYPITVEALVSGHPRDAKEVSVTGADRLRKCKKNTDFVWEVRKNRLYEGGSKLSRAVRLRRIASTVCPWDRHIVNLKRNTELRRNCLANQNHNLYRIRIHNHNPYHNQSVLTFYKLLRLLEYILQLKTSHSQSLHRASLRTNDTVCDLKLYLKNAF